MMTTSDMYAYYRDRGFFDNVLEEMDRQEKC